MRFTINKKGCAKAVTKYTLIMIGIGMILGAGVLAIIFYFVP